MIRNILFDLGGVLIDLDPQRSIEAFKRLLSASGEASPVSTLDLLGAGESQLVEQYQTGAITSDDFFGSIQRLCRPGTSRQELVEAWRAMLLSLPERRLAKIRQLKAKGYHIYILSNINEDHVEWTLEHFRQWGITVGIDIDQVFFSNEIHIAKPDVRCYEYVIRTTGIQPTETIYIDDLQQNIAAGKEVGFVTLQALGDEWLGEIDKLLR